MDYSTHYLKDRNTFLRQMATSIRKQSVKPEFKLEFVQLANKLHCSPPLSGQEVKEIFENSDNPFFTQY